MNRSEHERTYLDFGFVSTEILRLLALWFGGGGGERKKKVTAVTQ